MMLFLAIASTAIVVVLLPLFVYREWQHEQLYDRLLDAVENADERALVARSELYELRQERDARATLTTGGR